MKKEKQKVSSFMSSRGNRFLVWGFSAAMLSMALPVSAEGNQSMGTSTLAEVQVNNKTVSGTVLDESGEPLIGVSVLVQGTTHGTVTDMDGKFSLDVPSNAVLEVSYIGYQTQKVKVAGQRALSIVMKSDNKVLDEVVVVGYGTVKKRDLTGAVASMKNADVVIAPTNNVMEALQGKIAGMDITKTSGEIGDDVSILLRGSRSIYGDNEPLFIIDGIPGSYSQVNPSDIESVDVLKDASSTAIYGSAGANGVVIITTKRGKEGKATVNFDAYYGFSGSPNFQHGMTGEEWVNYQRESYKTINGSYPADMATLFGNPTFTEAYNQGKWIDWVDEVAGNTATTQKYSLSVNGGTEKTRVFASTSYSRDEGLLKNDNMDKYTMRLNIDQTINQWAKMGFTSNLTFSNRNRGQSNTFTKALTAFPLGDVYNEDGNLNSEYITGQYTPLGDFIENQYAYNTRSTYINSNAFLELTPIKDLTFRSQLSATLSNSRTGRYWGKDATANLPSYGASPYAQKTHDDSWSYTWENVLSYNKTLGDHTFGGQLISSWTKTQTEETIAGGGGYLVDSWQFHRLASASGNQYIYSDFTQTQKMSYAVRLNYSYKGKYLVTFSNRWDGVSWFSEGNKWDSFPAGAIAWRISDEGFMEGTKNWLNNLKLRVGYGITGNSGGTGAYVTQSQAYLYPAWGVSKEGKYVQFAQFTGTYAGGSLGWEKSYNWNVGLDFALFNNRLDGSIEWFNTQTKGLLFKRTLPITTGVTGWGSPLSSWQNLAKTANHGVEITLNSHNYKTKDFSWDTSLSVTWSKEKIKSLPDGDVIASSLFEGSPIKAVYGYKYAGLWKSTDSEEEMNAYGVKPGYIKIETIEQFDKDGNGDGGVHKYSTNDRMVLGHENPDWIIGLNNSLSYKGFDLSVFAMARYGQTISSDLLGYYTASNSITTNQLSGVKYWTEEDEDAYYPRPGTASYQGTVYSALRVVDGSFIKIKNITLGYTLPKSISRKALMEKARIYVTAYNPFIFAKDSKLKDTDPETGGSDSFPTYKQYVFGVNITF
jgi:TonB-linked SusC/RagA family outer membrane protein